LDADAGSARILNPLRKVRILRACVRGSSPGELATVCSSLNGTGVMPMDSATFALPCAKALIEVQHALRLRW